MLTRSGLALISDVALVMADQAWPGGEAPEWCSGRLLMAAMALLVLFPLCLQRHMRQVRARARGVAGWLLHHCCAAFPSLACCCLLGRLSALVLCAMTRPLIACGTPSASLYSSRRRRRRAWRWCWG